MWALVGGSTKRNQKKVGTAGASQLGMGGTADPLKYTPHYIRHHTESGMTVWLTPKNTTPKSPICVTILNLVAVDPNLWTSVGGQKFRVCWT